MILLAKNSTILINGKPVHSIGSEVKLESGLIEAKPESDLDEELTEYLVKERVIEFYDGDNEAKKFKVVRRDLVAQYVLMPVIE